MIHSFSKRNSIFIRLRLIDCIQPLMLRDGRLCRGNHDEQTLSPSCLRQSLLPDLTEAADLSLLSCNSYQHSILA